jgi:hypothetical protein
MSALSIQPTYPIFTETDGQPLENGYIWIGTVNLDPQTNPIAVYWDAALTLPAAQPIRTLAGYPANSGTPARLYVNSDYSIRVMNKNGGIVYSAPAATERYGNVISIASLDFVQAGVGAVTRTALSKMREPISAADFGAVEDGVSDDSSAIVAAFAEAQTRPVITTGTPVQATSISSEIGRLQSQNVVFSNRNDGIVGLNNADYPDAQNMTWATGERFVQSFRNGQSSANSIYNAIFPSVNNFDALQGITDIAPGSTIEHAVGVSGYVRNRTPSPTNGVGLFGCGTAEVDGAYVWGINTLLQDSSTRAAGTATGRGLINELDFNVMNPGTQVIGLSIGGNSLAQPTNSLGFVVNSLGTGYKWEFGFLTIDGAANNAIKIGTESASGSNVNGQRIVFGFKDGSGIDQTALMQMTGSGFLVLQSGVWNGLSVQGGSIYLDNAKALIVSGDQVVTNRQTGWQLPTGTENRTSFDTSTVTTAQLAQRVYALIKDLYLGHGLIGA